MKNATEEPVIKTKYRIDEMLEDDMLEVAEKINFSGYYSKCEMSIPVLVGRDIVSDMIKQLFETNKAVCDVWTEITSRWSKAVQEKAFVENVLLPAIAHVVVGKQNITVSIPDSFEEGKQMTFEGRILRPF